MNITTNRAKTKNYRINCSLDQTAQVRKLAEKYAADRTVVGVRANGYLLKDNVRVTVSFLSDKLESTIYQAVLNEFKDYNIHIVARCMFIETKKEKWFD